MSADEGSAAIIRALDDLHQGYHKAKDMLNEKYAGPAKSAEQVRVLMDSYAKDVERVVMLMPLRIMPIPAPTIGTRPEPEKLPKVTSRLPHSRACGPANHPHGSACKSDCPTCHGKSDWADRPTT